MTQTPTHPASIPLRLQLRLDILNSKSEDESALLMSADRHKLVFRAHRPFAPDETITIIAEPSMQHQYRFDTHIVHSQRILIPEQQLDYFEIHAEVGTNEDQYLEFLTGLHQTCQELGEDVRLYVRLPVTLAHNNRAINTHCENISVGGAFIEYDAHTDLPKPKSDIDLSIGGAESTSPCFKGKGNVLYTITPQDAERFGVQPGLGIRLHFDESTRQQWTDYVETLRREALATS